jgi:hypothetical protein
MKMANVNGIHHVIRSELEPGEGKKAYCGRTVYRHDMPIQLDHAKACIDQGTYLQPCKNCMKKANKQGE